MWPGSSWFSEKKFIHSSNVENPMKKKESEELEQIERHFEDEEIYFKQVNLFGYHMDCFSDQEINKTPAWKTPKKWLKRKLEWGLKRAKAKKNIPSFELWKEQFKVKIKLEW